MDIPGPNDLTILDRYLLPAGPSGGLRQPVHFWTGLPGDRFRSCQVWWGPFVWIRAGSDASFFWRRTLGRPAGTGALHNVVAHARLSRLPLVPPVMPISPGPHPRPVKTGQILNNLCGKPGTFLTGHGLPARCGFTEGAAQHGHQQPASPSVGRGRKHCTGTPISAKAPLPGRRLSPIDSNYRHTIPGAGRVPMAGYLLRKQGVHSFQRCG